MRFGASAANFVRGHARTGRRNGSASVVREYGRGANMAKTVLIVEDNELNMKLFNDLLDANGFNILQAMNGEEAFRLAKEHVPDLIVMDVQLPEASGLEVTQWIKAEPSIAGIPVVAVTALAMKGDEEKILSAGCDAYIAKPISVHAFLDTVKRFLG
jgi:two-component system cell cycle response regulator DivK